jgi:uncharacterized Zn-binding protein involved in type VI secretion
MRELLVSKVHRFGDVNTAGGAIDGIPQTFVYENNLLICVDGSIGTGHPPCPIPAVHCAGNWITAGGASFVVINDIPVNREGDADTCGHARSGGSDFIEIV